MCSHTWQWQRIYTKQPYILKLKNRKENNSLETSFLLCMPCILHPLSLLFPLCPLITISLLLLFIVHLQTCSCLIVGLLLLWTFSSTIGCQIFVLSTSFSPQMSLIIIPYYIMSCYASFGEFKKFFSVSSVCKCRTTNILTSKPPSYKTVNLLSNKHTRKFRPIYQISDTKTNAT